MSYESLNKKVKKYRYLVGATSAVTTWTTRASAADNNWWGVCWSPELGIFCAVSTSGSGNRVMTSPDGITWTTRTSAADNNWYSVCWSPELGLFCSTANSGTGTRIMTSTCPYPGKALANRRRYLNQQGIRIKERADINYDKTFRQGVATLASGTATIANTTVTANTRIFLSWQSTGGTVGMILRVSARTAGTSFTITSYSVGTTVQTLDTSTVMYQMIEPA